MRHQTFNRPKVFHRKDGTRHGRRNCREEELLVHVLNDLSSLRRTDRRKVVRRRTRSGQTRRDHTRRREERSVRRHRNKRAGRALPSDRMLRRVNGGEGTKALWGERVPPRTLLRHDARERPRSGLDGEDQALVEGKVQAEAQRGVLPLPAVAVRQEKSTPKGSTDKRNSERRGREEGLPRSSCNRKYTLTK